MWEARRHVHDVSEERESGKLIGELTSEEPERRKRRICLQEVIEDERGGNPFILDSGEGFHAKTMVRELLGT